jgi:PKD repeat protein
MKKNYETKEKVMLLLLFFITKIAFGQGDIYLYESFNTATGGTPPSGWTVVTKSGTSEDVFRFDNPGNRTFGKTPSGAPYAIFDSDNYSNNGTAEDVELISPTVNLQGKNIVTLRYYEYFEGGFNGQIEVYGSKDNGNNWTLIRQSTATSKSNPEMVVLNVGTTIGQSQFAKIKFRWVGNSSFWWLIDDIQLYKPPAQDAGALAANDLVRNCLVSLNQPLTATFKNYGTGNISGVEFNYKVNDEPTVKEASSIFIPKDSSYTYTFSTLMKLKEGLNKITIWPSKPSNVDDGDNSNDTLVVETAISQLQVATLPFIENFESGTFQVSMCANLGASGNGRIRITDNTVINPCNGNKMVVLDASKAASTIDNLDLLVDLSSCVDKILSFTYGHANDNNDQEDGLYLSVNNGATFTKIFDFSLNNLNNNTCYNVSLNIDSIARARGLSLSQQSLLRWSHAGNNTIESGEDGIFIDDISINIAVLKAVDAGISTIKTPEKTIFKDSTYTVSAYLKNFPSSPDTLVAVNVNYQFNNGPVITEFWGGCMVPGDSFLFNFTNKLEIGSTLGEFDLCVWTSIPANLNIQEINNANDKVCEKIKVICSPVKANFTATNTCKGTETVFTDQSTNAISWTWNFGDNSSSSSEINPLHIYSSAGTYGVTLIVADAKSCTDTLTKTIEIFNPPTANFSASSACLGNKTIFTDASTDAIEWNWDFGDGSSSSEKNPEHTYANSGSYVVKLIVKSSQGCSNQTEKTIVVNALPLAFAGNDATIECGEQLQLNGSASGGMDPYNYLWSNGSTSSSISVGAGTYLLTVKDANGCEGTDEVVVSLNSTLSLTVSNDTTICAGTKATLMATVTGGSDPYSYSWSNGATTNSIIEGGGTYTVTVTDAGNCSLSGYIKITENPVLTVSAGADQTICFGTSTTITALATGGNSTYSYEWNNAATTSSITVQPGVYSVTVKDGSGCTAKDTISVIENPSLSVNVGNDKIICFGSFAEITASVSGGNGNYSYAWNTGEITASIQKQEGFYSVNVTDGIGCTATDNITISPGVVVDAGFNKTVLCGETTNLFATASNGQAPYSFVWSNGINTANNDNVIAGQYFVTVTDGLGCSYTDSVSVILLGSDLKVELGNEVVTCNIASVTLMATVTGGTAPFTYTWNTAESTETIVAGTTGTYSVLVKDSENCTFYDEVKVYLQQVNADFTADKDTLDLYSGTTVNFSNLSTGATIYNWNFGNGNTSTDASPAATFTNTGSYEVVLIARDDKACADTVVKTITIVNTTGIEKVNVIPVKIYPNPAQDYIMVAFEKEEAITIEIYNMLGEKILIQKDKTSNTKVDLSELTNGQYVLKMATAKGTISKKLTILK